MSSYCEIHPRRRRKVGKNHWKAWRRFECDTAYAAALENTLYGSVMPGFSGAYAPKCKTVESLSGFEPGKQLLIAYYETLRQPGKATVRLDVWYDLQTKRVDLIGDVIEGADPDNIHWWRVVKGTNKIPEARCKLIVETAYDTFNVNDVMSRVGHVNLGTLTNLGNARPGSMLLLGAPNTRWWPEGGLWYINYAFAYSGPDETWNEKLKSRKGVHCARIVPVFDQEGSIDTTIPDKYVSDFIFKEVYQDLEGDWKTRNTSAEDRVIFSGVSFADLNGMVEW